MSALCSRFYPDSGRLNRISQVPTSTLITCHALGLRGGRNYCVKYYSLSNTDVVFTFIYRLDPHQSLIYYLSGLYRLRVIIPTQWPIISLSTLRDLRCLNHARLGTERNQFVPILDTSSTAYSGGINQNCFRSPTGRRQLCLAHI